MRGARSRVILMLVSALIMLAIIRSFTVARLHGCHQATFGLAESVSGSVQPTPTFVGAGGCAAMACHGGTRANERHEYTTWIEHDRHARAFLVLYEEVALRMARKLGIERPEQDGRCLSCHSTGVDSPRGPKFSLEDGVSCEACHGPAEHWLASHSKPEWQSRPAQEKYGPLGMFNTKDVMVRAAVCLRCHLGEPGREVTHDLIAAGHPALVFELDAYTANMPPHWRETANKGTPFGAQAWATGQAVSLRQSLELLASRAKRADWPEFAEFECRACHHDLSGKSARQELGFADRRPGSPVWSNPHLFIALRQGGDGQQSGANEFLALRKLLQDASASPRDIAVAAEKAADTASELTRQFEREWWDQDRLRRLLMDLSTDLPAQSLDYSSAASTTMALGAVFEAFARLNAQPGTDDAAWVTTMRRALDVLYDDVQRPSSFDAQKFALDLRSFRQAAP